MLTVRRVSFHRRADGVLVVMGAGDFPHRALPLVAQVGAVHVHGISVSPDGRRFSGLLKSTPSAGDEVVVGFPPEPLTRTGIRFPSRVPTEAAAAVATSPRTPRGPGPA